MTGIICSLTENVDTALKSYAVAHGGISKSKAAEALVEQWLVEKGYLDQLHIDPLIGDDGYEYLEDA